MITLHDTLDALSPIRRYANLYREMVENQVKAKMHRYYVIENGNHVDPFYNLYLRRARPPCGGYCPATGQRSWSSSNGSRTKAISSSRPPTRRCRTRRPATRSTSAP